MTFHQCKDYSLLSEEAARWLMERIRKNPECSVGVATGQSPLGMYRHIAKSSNLNTKSLSLFQLDEWVGITDFRNSCMNYLEKEVRVPWGISRERAHYFSADQSLLQNKVQAEIAAASMQKVLDTNGPLDILILGMGKNGHLGFMEPADSWPPEKCFVSKLAPSSRQHLMISQEASAPEFGVTMGLRAILEAKKILFVVTGSEKSRVYSEWLKKEVKPQLPASILWKHPHVFVVTDL